MAWYSRPRARKRAIFTHLDNGGDHIHAVAVVVPFWAYFIGSQIPATKKELLRSLWVQLRLTRLTDSVEGFIV